MTLTEQFRAVLLLALENRASILELAKEIAARTNEPDKTVHERIRRWANGQTPNINQLESVLDVLGYETVIQEKKSEN